MRRLISVLATTTLLVSASAAMAADIAVPLDEARIITFTRPVATLFVANPVVADVNIIDATHAFVLGKAFGSTNMIALDADKNQISNSRVSVYGGHALVTLNRGANQFTFACVRVRCEAAGAPGDMKTWYDDNLSEVDKREDMGSKAASPSGGH